MAAPFYTPEQRQQVMDGLLASLEKDPRIAGVLVVGSGAVGFTDDYSDVDFAVVVTAEADVVPVAAAWPDRVAALGPVRGHFENVRAPSVILHGFLLDNFLEIDASFQHLGNLAARREHWRVAFDRSGQIANLMQTTWANRAAPDKRGLLRHHLDLWYYVTHVVTGVRRGQFWRAVCDLDMIRTMTVELAGARLDLNTAFYHDADQLPPDILEPLAATLVQRVDPAEIMRALRAVIPCFFREAYALAGLDAAPGASPAAVADLERSIQIYLAAYP